MTPDERFHYLVPDLDRPLRDRDYEARFQRRWFEVYGRVLPYVVFLNVRHHGPSENDSRPVVDTDPDPLGFVYFFHAEVVNRVKIGYTLRHPSERLANCQIGCPVPLVLLGAIRGQKDDEFAAHRRFRAYRETGEWFRFEGELERFVREEVIPAWSAPSLRSSCPA